LDDALWYPGVHCDSVVRAVKNRGQFWLGGRIALVKAGQSRIPKSVVAKLLIRYPVAFGLVLVAFKTGWLPPMAILAGLFVPVAGVLIEAIIQIGEGLLSPHPS
jgi:hypothetical protein